ncbi:SDR family oxidoreductase [Haloferax sulfurifontis]|uniref:Short-chain family oxidoreductase n=1 Tax=Haloferax sulfurifontis ATCC BAA-897 TaxID=662480 RepID=M0I082_9EURY|nr:SDR family oxidoreductase [Haloferax sulfurifontis]ELZ90235.1 short-chain family oxidoreductase [Haloferax sulfurifontis ATCC BAA-897]
MDLGLDGDTVVVTASSAGLGRASAAALADEGANVVVCGRDPERLAATESELGDLDGDVLGVETDITSKGDVEALVEAAVEEFGGVDHVVTSAGGVPPGGFADLTEQEWYGAFDMLVMSAVWTVRAARPHLEASDAGTITCITSTSVREVIDDLILSNAVRRGVIGLVKSLSRELAPSVRVNAVLPGAHETSRIEELVEAAVERGDHDTYEEGLSSWSDGIPLGRVGDPRELGDVVAFLASDRASFVTGACVPVDGGRLRSA